MPHFLIERTRQMPKTSIGRWTLPIAQEHVALLVEALDVVATITFVAGSISFLPCYSWDLKTFIVGCNLFLVGSTIYFLICTFNLLECLEVSGRMSFEAWENVLYLVGSILFWIGTILYMPDEQHCGFIDKTTGQCISLIQEVTIDDREFMGAVFFAVGSVVFAFGAFTNALSQAKFSDWSHKMLVVITGQHMAGSILFAMGSVSFLPHMGCNSDMLYVGAWCFIIGSLFFFFGAVESLMRTHWMLACKSAEHIHLCTAESECA